MRMDGERWGKVGLGLKGSEIGKLGVRELEIALASGLRGDEQRRPRGDSEGDSRGVLGVRKREFRRLYGAGYVISPWGGRR